MTIVTHLRTCVFGLRRDLRSIVRVAPSVRPLSDVRRDRECLEDSFGRAVRLFEYWSCPKKFFKIFFKNFQPRDPTSRRYIFENLAVSQTLLTKFSEF